MRNGNPPGAPTVAPTPPICGLKNLAATDDIVTRADNPFTGVSVPLSVQPGIFELCHSIGNVIGVAPSTLKSYPSCVYFQMYCASTTKWRPTLCCSPAWNSLRKPGLNGAGLHGPSVLKIAFRTGS